MDKRSEIIDENVDEKIQSKYVKILTEFEESNIENDYFQDEEDQKNKDFNIDNDNDNILMDIRYAMIEYCEEMALPLCNKNFNQYSFDNFISFLMNN
jgi:hypothetical protein